MHPKAEKNTEVGPNHGEHRACASVFFRVYSSSDESGEKR